MAYFANQKLTYNGVTYGNGDQIKDFGIGKYDDLLLESKMIGSDGMGTGVEDKIVHQKTRRNSQWKTIERSMNEEESFLADVKKYSAEKDLKTG